LENTMRKYTSGFFIMCFLLFPYSSGMLLSESHAAGDTADQFLGSWSLVSFKDKNEQGETIDRYGKGAFGRIVYGANGNMMVVLMRHGREDLQDPDFFSYTGSYDVDAAAGTVTHHIEACIAPSWVGVDRVRKFEMLDANRIALRPVEGTSELIWQREK